MEGSNVPPSGTPPRPLSEPEQPQRRRPQPPQVPPVPRRLESPRGATPPWRIPPATLPTPPKKVLLSPPVIRPLSRPPQPAPKTILPADPVVSAAQIVVPQTPRKLLPPRPQPSLPKAAVPPASPSAVRPAGTKQEIQQDLTIDTVAQTEVNQLLTSDDVTIRTMQEDLLGLSSTTMPPVASEPRSKTVDTIAVRSAQPTATNASRLDRPLTAPLPPKNVGKPGKVVMPPTSGRRAKHSLLPWVLVLLVVTVVSGGVLTWFFWSDLPFAVSEQEAPTVASNEVQAILPTQTAAIIGYRFASAEDRSAILTMWGGTTTDSITALLAGDPRTLVSDASIDHLFYVLLEDDTRPYLVVPQTPSTETLLGTSADARVQAVNGWYIAHSVNIEPYITALENGSLAAAGGNDVLTAAAGGPLQVVLGPSLLIRLRESMGGSSLANGLIQEIGLTARPIAQNTALDVQGLADYLSLPEVTGQALQPPVADQQLLTLIPETATAAILGARFSDDIHSWANHSGVLDTTSLEEPAVASLLNQLQTPYAFYVETKVAGAFEYGAIVELPPELAGTLTAPDATIENGMSALLPLITGRAGVAPIAFSNNTYAGIPLRYANFSQPSQAMDYAVTSHHLLLATSREAMFRLLDLYAGTGVSVANSPTWAATLAAWGSVPQARSVVLGSATDATLAKLLPGQTTDPLQFGMTFETGLTGAKATAAGVILLPTTVTAPIGEEDTDTSTVTF